MKELTPEQIMDWKKKIDAMSQEDMARLWRFAPCPHPIFVTGTELFGYFEKRFNGFTPEISKAIGWGS